MESRGALSCLLSYPLRQDFSWKWFQVTSRAQKRWLTSSTIWTPARLVSNQNTILFIRLSCSLWTKPCSPSWGRATSDLQAWVLRSISPSTAWVCSSQPHGRYDAETWIEEVMLVSPWCVLLLKLLQFGTGDFPVYIANLRQWIKCWTLTLWYNRCCLSSILLLLGDSTPSHAVHLVRLRGRHSECGIKIHLFIFSATVAVWKCIFGRENISDGGLLYCCANQ